MRHPFHVSALHHLGGIGRAAAVVALVVWFAFAAIVLALRYVVLPHVADYRTSIEGVATKALGETVTIGSLDASWHGIRPALSLRAVRIVDRDGKTTLELPAVDATLSWESLLVLDLRLARLEIDGPQLAITRDATGQIFVAGRPIRRRDTPDDRLAEWVLSQDQLHVRNARIDWHDEMPVDSTAGPATPREIALSDVDASLVRSGWRHRFALRATLPADLAAPVDVRASIEHPLFGRLSDTATWKGELYANVASADIGSWREVVRLPASIEHGRGRVRSWVRFTDAATATSVVNASLGRSRDDDTGQTFLVLGRLSEVVADLALDDLAVREGASVRVALASVDGRVTVSQDARHQAVTARGLVLRPVDGPSSTSTDLAVRRTLDPAGNGRSEAGEATLSTVDIGALLALIPPGVMPKPIADKLAAFKPAGVLDHLRLRWNGPESNPDGFTFDGGFTKLSIAPQAPTAEAIAAAGRTFVEANGLVRKARPAFGQPGFENLSGTIHAARTTKDGVANTTVDVALKSDDATVIAPGLFDDPRLRFARLEAAVDIRMNGEDLEFAVRRAVVENADLAASADVTFRRGPRSGSPQRGWVDVDVHLTRAEVGRVPRYLPNLIGEKARRYLSKALVSGKVTDATFRMKGTLESLNVRAQADSLAAANPMPLAKALAAVRERPARGTTAANGSPDEPTLRAVVKVKNATYLYGPARSVEEITAAAAANGTPLAQPVVASVAWPAFEDVDADVIFDHASLKVVARTANYQGFKLTDVVVDLPAIADPTHVLRAVGRGTGPLQDLVRFVNASPIARWTRNAFANTQAKGNATLALALDLPLGHARDADVVGSVDLAKDAIAINPQVPPLTKLDGRVDFTDKGLTIAGLTGEALGGPVRFDATTRSDGLIEAKATGTIDARALRVAEPDTEDAYSAPRIVQRLAHRLEGSTPYVVGIRLHSKRVADGAASRGSGDAAADAAMPDVVVDSTLKGIAIDLPAPFDKKADDAWPLHLEISRTAASTANATRNYSVVEGEDVRMTIADRVAVSVSRHRNAQGLLAVTRAGYAVGRNANAVELSGVRIDVPSIDVDAWREVVKELATPQPGETVPAAATAANAELVAALVPDHIVVETAALHGAGRDFGHVSLDARRARDGWQADVASDQVAGHLAYTDVSGKVTTRNGIAPVSSGRLVARLSRLSIPKGEADGARMQDALDAGRRREFPAIDLVADRFELRGRDLGRLEVVAENVGDDSHREWKLDKLGLSMPEATFTATGAWGRGGDDERTSLTFAIDASNVGTLLDRLGVPKTIKDGTAKLTGHVAWNGGPTTIDFASMTGKIALETGKGQFLKVDPGIAKLLGVLSLQSIPRRLLLDFSDVFEAGFAFDAVTADATIERGVASTDNFKMRGPQANVMMSGTADLARETTDLHVLVLPQVNAGAASLGFALVNPVIGLATFAAQYLFKDPIARALSIEYNVTGPWTKPIVSKLDRDGNATPVAPRNVPSAAPSAQIDPSRP